GEEAGRRAYPRVARPRRCRRPLLPRAGRRRDPGTGVRTAVGAGPTRPGPRRAALGVRGVRPGEALRRPEGLPGRRGGGALPEPGEGTGEDRRGGEGGGPPAAAAVPGPAPGGDRRHRRHPGGGGRRDPGVVRRAGVSMTPQAAFPRVVRRPRVSVTPLAASRPAADRFPVTFPPN